MGKVHLNRITGGDVIRQAKLGLKRLARGGFFPFKTRPAVAAAKCHHWSIGIFAGESPLRLVSPPPVSNPVISHKEVTDVQANFVADPFMLRVNGVWHMFFEVENRKAGKGEIGLATSDDGLRWTYRQIVLAEPFHLSYPYVFEWRGEYYMIPESYQAGSVRLYKANKFPTDWALVKNLLDGAVFNDPSIFRHENRWWLFVESAPVPQCDTLRLYYADDLLGPWFEHSKSPVIKGNAHIARPAGRVLVSGTRIIRYAQDCYPIYGTQVRAFEVTDLTTTAYEEREIAESPVLTASGSGWNKSGMHHLDPHLMEDGGWIACVDGFCWKEPTAS